MTTTNIVVINCTNTNISDKLRTFSYSSNRKLKPLSSIRKIVVVMPDPLDMQTQDFLETTSSPTLTYAPGAVIVAIPVAASYVIEVMPTNDQQ